ncbi:MAG: hypothetical protein ABIB71_03080 [Candidatus Woesearchaeota archaeon]
MNLVKKLKQGVLFAGGLCLLLGLTAATGGRAKPTCIKDIPNGKAYSCKTCHNSGGYKADNLNLFGADFKANEMKWGGALAKKDSDGDGKSNGWELGDENGTWKNGDSNPYQDRDIYNPGDKNSHP